MLPVAATDRCDQLPGSRHSILRASQKEGMQTMTSCRRMLPSALTEEQALEMTQMAVDGEAEPAQSPEYSAARFKLKIPPMYFMEIIQPSRCDRNDGRGD